MTNKTENNSIHRVRNTGLYSSQIRVNKHRLHTLNHICKSMGTYLSSAAYAEFWRKP